jgi:hypothetical protein
MVKRNAGYGRKINYVKLQYTENICKSASGYSKLFLSSDYVILTADFFSLSTICTGFIFEQFTKIIVLNIFM